MQNILQQDSPCRLPSNRQYAQPDQPHAAHLQALILACGATPTAIAQADVEPLLAVAELAISHDRKIPWQVFCGRGNFHRSSIKRSIEQSTVCLRGGIPR